MIVTNKSSERLFDLMLKQATGKFVDEMVDKYPDSKEMQGKYEFSPEFEKKIQKIIDSERRRVKHSSFKNASYKFLKTGKRIAIAICIIIATFSLVAFTIQPIRVALMNFYIERHDEYISFDLQEQGEENDKAPDVNLSVIITYVPAGYEIFNIVDNESALSITYSNSNQFIHFERYSGSAKITLDGEGVEFKKIMIGGKEGYISSKNEMNTVIINDEYYGYKLSSEISMDELVKMMESIF